MLQMSFWHSFQLSFSFQWNPSGICTVPLRAWASYVVRHSIGPAPFSSCNVAETNVSNWSPGGNWNRRVDLYSIFFFKQIWRHGFQNSSFKLFVFSWGVVTTYDPSPFTIVLKALRWRNRAKSLTEFGMLIRPRVPREIAPKTWKMRSSHSPNNENDTSCRTWCALVAWRELWRKVRCGKKRWSFSRTGHLESSATSCTEKIRLCKRRCEHSPF